MYIEQICLELHKVIDTWWFSDIVNLTNECQDSFQLAVAVEIEIEIKIA